MIYVTIIMLLHGLESIKILWKATRSQGHHPGFADDSGKLCTGETLHAFLGRATVAAPATAFCTHSGAPARRRHHDSGPPISSPCPPFPRSSWSQILGHYGCISFPIARVACCFRWCRGSGLGNVGPAPQLPQPKFCILTIARP